MSELNINTDIDYIVNRINPGNKPYLIALSISLIDNIGFTKEQVCAIFAKYFKNNPYIYKRKKY